MGVHGLWKLLETAGKPIPVEKLENRVLSIDVSIWLYQIIKGVQENEHSKLTNVHLIVMFHRICKLLFYGIKPVFVFDGGVPQLKRQTIAQRQAQKIRAKKTSSRAKEKLLKNMLKQAALKTVINPENILSEEEIIKKTVNTLNKQEESDLFELPKLPEKTNEIINKVETNKIETLQSSGFYKEDRENLLMLVVEKQSNDCFSNSVDKGKSSVKLNTFSSLQIGDLLQKYADDQKHLMNRKKLQKSKQEMTVSEMEMFLNGDNTSVDLDHDFGQKLNSDHDTVFYYQSSIKTKNSSNSPIFSKSNKNSFGKIIDQKDIQSTNTITQDIITLSDDDDDIFKALAGDESLEEDRLAWLAFNENKKASKKRSDEFESPRSISSKQKTSFEYPNTVNTSDDVKDIFNAKCLSNKHSTECLFLKNDEKSDENLTDDLINEDYLAWIALNSSKQSQKSEKIQNIINDNMIASTSKNTSNFSENNITWSPSSSVQDITGISLNFNSESDSSDSSSFFENTSHLSPNESFYFSKENSPVNIDELIRKTEIEELKIQLSSPVKEKVTACYEKSNGNHDILYKFKSPESTLDLPKTTKNTTISSKECTPISTENVISFNEKPDILNKINSFSTDKLKFPKRILELSKIKKLIDNSPTNNIYDSSERLTQKKEKDHQSFDTQYLSDIKDTLVRQENHLTNLQKASDRLASSVTQKISSEMKNLLRMFGIPYITAPMEAEAQCAYLEKNGHTDGTITDDSDIWLFGANIVIKDFFDNKKYVKQFRSIDIKQKLGLSQSNFIQMAFLVGSDYTNGIEGVGPVTAIEMLSFFDSKTKYKNIEDKLLKIKEIVNSKSEIYNDIPFVKKLKSVTIEKDFPNKAVINAYMNPIIDECEGKFSWSLPEMDKLMQYALTNFDWSISKTKITMDPILKKITERTTQKTLDSYMKVLPTLSNQTVGMSKRVSHAVKRLRDNCDSTISSETDQKNTKIKKLTTAIEANKHQATWIKKTLIKKKKHK
ncbi:DNA excision repair protein ERCC-5 [Daktulosphaira vitifoliae]|uniref:DNA excision repair protein ERCC-5 n=1 Tax=Daktulosphaira vitifoliae TaxID=58002 RepID=UPI0021A9ACA6|nr:DNA excision repair protein ERCC-5 [Daktulosphaira vitifoliae]